MKIGEIECLFLHKNSREYVAQDGVKKVFVEYQFNMPSVGFVAFTSFRISSDADLSVLDNAQDNTPVKVELSMRAFKGEPGIELTSVVAIEDIGYGS